MDEPAEAAIKLSEDNEFLARVRIPPRTALNISNTLGALIGHCARYANEQLSHFFQVIYANPSAIFDVLAKIGGGIAGTRFLMPYKLLIDSVIFESSGHSVSERIANLYLPTRGNINDKMPSLVKVRSLLFLRHWRRVTVSQLIQHLALYGVPSEVGIEGLNSLHNKERLLLWFSENHEIKSENQDGDQYVVISEHGLNYIQNVIGDFEYIWACAAQIGDHDLRDAPFSIRLAEYVNLVTNLGQTEWKQLAYRRCHSGYAKPGAGNPEFGELIVLRILYSSFARVIGGAEPILKALGNPQSDRAEAANEALLQVEKICELILCWQERYSQMFGGNGYIEVYEELIADARKALARAIQLAMLPEYCKSLLETILNDWTTESATKSTNPGQRTTTKKDDFITTAARYLRSFLPFPQSWLSAADNNIALNIHLERYESSELEVNRLIEKSFPSYREIEDALLRLLRDTQSLISLAERIGPSTGTDFYKNLLAECDWLNEQISALQQSQITEVGSCSSVEMSERKSKFNRIIAVFESLGRRYSSHDLPHLKVYWR